MEQSTNGHATAGDGTRLAYQWHGTGRPLVLLAGQSNNHTWWNRSRGDFPSTLTMDYRGTGTSDRPDMPYSTLLFAEDVLTVLDALDVEQADIYGTSMGGRVAQWFAALHPERVRRLVLGCTSPGGDHGIERTNDIRRSLIGPNKTAALTDLMYTPEWQAANPGPYHVLGDPRMPPHASRHHLLASNEHDAWDALPHITAPTLVLHGEDDLLTPAANAPLLAHRIPNARTHLFPGARHAYFDECRPLASTLVTDFLTADL